VRTPNSNGELGLSSQLRLKDAQLGVSIVAKGKRGTLPSDPPTIGDLVYIHAVRDVVDARLTNGDEPVAMRALIRMFMHYLVRKHMWQHNRPPTNAEIANGTRHRWSFRRLTAWETHLYQVVDNGLGVRHLNWVSHYDSAELAAFTKPLVEPTNSSPEEE